MPRPSITDAKSEEFSPDVSPSSEPLCTLELELVPFKVSSPMFCSTSRLDRKVLELEVLLAERSRKTVLSCGRYERDSRKFGGRRWFLMTAEAFFMISSE